MTVHRTVTDGRTILGLPGKIGNANIETSYESKRFFLPVTVHRTVGDGMDKVVITIQKDR